MEKEAIKEVTNAEFYADKIIKENCISLHWLKNGGSCGNHKGEDEEKCINCRADLKAWLCAPVPKCMYIGAFCHDDYQCDNCPIYYAVKEYKGATGVDDGE